MRKVKYALAVLLWLGVSDPAYAHGEQILWVMASHLFVLAGVLVFLLFYPARRVQKVITFTVLLLAIVTIWVVPGPIGWLYFFDFGKSAHRNPCLYRVTNFHRHDRFNGLDENTQEGQPFTPPDARRACAPVSLPFGATIRLISLGKNGTLRA